MATDRIELQIVLDDGSVQKGFANIERQAQKSAGNISSSFLGFTGKLVAGLGAIAGAISFRKAINEAIEGEQASQRFAQSLANLGQFSRQAVDSFNTFTQELSKTTGVQDDIILKNASLLVSLGRLSGDGLERATRAAINLQAAFGGSLEGAFEAIAQAANGNARALNGYGIRINELVPANERFSKSLDIIEQRFGGLAQNQAVSTFGGLLRTVGNSIDNFFESLGKLVTESVAVRETFKIINETINNLSKTVDGVNKGALDNLILGLIDVAKVINNFVGPSFEVFFRALSFGFGILKTAIFGFQTVIANVGSFLFSNLVDPIVRFFTFVGTDVLSVFNKDLADKLKTSILGFTSTLKNGLGIAGESTAEVFKDSITDIPNVFESVFNVSVSNSLDTFLTGYQTRINTAIQANQTLRDDLKNTAQSVGETYLTIGGAFAQFSAGFTVAFQDFAKNAIKNFQEVGKAAFTLLGQGVGNAFAAVGKAIVEGKNGIEAFLNSLLASFGQAAIQLGTQFILQGIAYTFAGLPNGGALVGAGAALATFGGVLSALGGSGGGSSASAGAGQSSSPEGGGINTEPTSPINDVVANEPREPDTKIELNIQGDVLDSEATGLRIVDLLNSAFDKSGVVVTGAV